MERMTKMNGAKRAEGYSLTAADTHEAANRLGRFEDVYEAVLNRLAATEAEMEKFRAQGKTKSVQFRELLVQKVSMENFLNMFTLYGIE